MDSIVLAVVVAVVVWLFVRRARMSRRRQVERQRHTEAGGEGAPKTMPRIGRHGTVTPAQLKALKDADFEPSRHWSREEAQLILDAVTYLRAVIREATGEPDAPIEIQNKVLGFILGDEELREFILDLERNRTREQEDTAELPIVRTPEFERVEAFVRELWEEG